MTQLNKTLDKPFAPCRRYVLMGLPYFYHFSSFVMQIGKDYVVLVCMRTTAEK